MLKFSACVGMVAAGLLAVSASAATAGQFRASYDFGGPATDGDVFSFEFDGDVNGNLIENVNNLGNFLLGGAAIFDPNDPFVGVNATGGPLSVRPGSSTLSVDGSQNTFFAGNRGNIDRIDFGFGATVRDFRPGGSQSHRRLGGFDSWVEVFDESRWLVVEAETGLVPGATVPTPALLPGLLSMGFAAIRKRNLAQSDEA